MSKPHAATIRSSQDRARSTQRCRSEADDERTGQQPGDNRQQEQEAVRVQFNHEAETATGFLQFVQDHVLPLFAEFTGQAYNYRQNVATLGRNRPRTDQACPAVGCRNGAAGPRLAENIIPQGKHHQREDQSQTDRHQDAQGAIAGRFSGDGFVGVKHQMPAIQRRNRKQVQKADRG